MTKTDHNAPLLFAALLLFSAACGDDDGGGGPDAAPADAAMADAVSPDAAVTNATVHATVGGLPLAGVVVVVERADGSFSAPVMTDGEGAAGIFVQAGDSVTAIADAEDQLFTWRDVAPGVELRMPLQGFGGTSGTGLAITATALAGADSYVFTAGECSTSAVALGGPVALALEPDCTVAGERTTLVATALDINAVVLGVAFARDIDVSSGGDIAVNLGAFNENVSDFDFAVTNIAAGVMLNERDGAVIADGLRHSLPTQERADGGTFQVVPGLADTLEYGLFYGTAPAPTAVSFGAILGSVDAGTANVSVDLGATALPSASAIARDDTDPANPVFTITYPSAPAVDLVAHQFEIDRGSDQLSWTVFTDASAAALASRPALPAALEVGGTITGLATVVLESDAWANYAEARAQAGNIFADAPVFDSASVLRANFSVLIDNATQAAVTRHVRDVWRTPGTLRR